MRVALFIPCYIDQFYPQVGIATLQLLEKLGCEVSFPLEQTCCGQPMANSGFASSSKGCDINFVKNFDGFDYIVAPSGSCILHIKEHLQDAVHPEKAAHIRNTVYELTEFLTDILKIEKLQARFPYKVGIHNSCHGQRGLHLSSMSERMLPSFSKPEQLLNMVADIQLSKPKRSDECCGFGGTFCVFEEAVSVKMGKDRIAEHDQNDVEYITAGDTSCLMHLEGILKRQGSTVKTIHIAEILNSSL
ncbi:L-lactate dehydrogenase complex protein LldE [Flavobacterium sp. PL11]|jgi:L-lactate dehydrogenase complex protein LldE|uniref:(Fe-S)-binding protein n=1 Tax=Flavobacterium sp. PL11 TaxID=3071717 RepID=UPI002E02FA86|nr:L-lactate dehydrogenase complex protein LldE [Flavobacterium sp. PL11]